LQRDIQGKEEAALLKESEFEQVKREINVREGDYVKSTKEYELKLQEEQAQRADLEKSCQKLSA
jgi:hypothetical protein